MPRNSALQTFEIRPTPADRPPDGRPDELMIDWGRLPPGSTAEIYLPAASADAVLAAADRWYPAHRLRQVDAHTLRCPAGGVSYLPIPQGGDGNLAGLLSIGVAGPVARDPGRSVVVRQVVEHTGREATPPGAAAPGAAAIGEATPGKAARIRRGPGPWRQVLGTFQVDLPVHGAALVLEREERLLSVLRWIQQAVAPGSRWFPVFQRYLAQFADHVHALGGDPATIGPSPTGDWRQGTETGTEPGGEPRGEPGAEHGEEHGAEPGGNHRAATGKVKALVYDRLGDFEGFVLDTEDGDRSFQSREREIEALAHRAWRDRILVSVPIDPDSPRDPLALILLATPGNRWLREDR